MGKVDVTVPVCNQPTTLQLLTAREGNVVSTAPLGSASVFIECLVPLRCMFGFMKELRSITQGQGEYAMEFHEYVQMPLHEQTKLAEKFTLPDQINYSIVD